MLTGGRVKLGKKSKQISFVESLLKDDEEIIHAHECVNDNAFGAVAITDSRLIFGSNTFFTGETIEEVEIAKIQAIEIGSISFTENVLTIYIKNSHQTIKLKSASTETLSNTRKILLQKMKGIEETVSNEAPPENNIGYSIADEIVKIAELKEKGHLTNSEFEFLKSKIINQ